MTRDDVLVEVAKIVAKHQIAHLERAIAKERRKPSWPGRLEALVADRDRLHALFWTLQDETKMDRPLEELVEIIEGVRHAREGTYEGRPPVKQSERTDTEGPEIDELDELGDELSLEDLDDEAEGAANA